MFREARPGDFEDIIRLYRQLHPADPYGHQHRREQVAVSPVQLADIAAAPAWPCTEPMLLLAVGMTPKLN